MTLLDRRRLLQYGAAVGGASLSNGLWGFDAEAAGFPSKAFSAYVAAKPGGGHDRFSRAIAPEFQRTTGQPMKLIFTPGAGGVLAATKILNAPPDGHTLGVIAISSMNVSIQFGKPDNFSFGAFAYLGTMWSGPLAIFTGKNSKWKSIEQVVEASKTQKITAAVAGMRQMYHVGGLIFNKAVGGNIQFVPYGGGSPSRKAAAAEEADIVWTGLFDANAQYSVLRCLCIFADKNPIPDIINAPTMHDVYPKQAVDLEHPTGYVTSAEVARKNPENYKFLVDKYREAHTSQVTRAALKKGGWPTKAIKYWSPEQIMEWEAGFRKDMAKISL